MFAIMFTNNIWGGPTTLKVMQVPGAELRSTALADLVDLVDLVDLGDLAGSGRLRPALASPRRLMSAPHTPF